MRQLYIIMHFFVIHIIFLYFCIFFVCLRLNLLVLFLSITLVVRCPCQERDWSPGDHVSTPDMSTPQIFIHTVTVDISQLLPPRSRPYWHLLPGRFTTSIFLFLLMCVEIIDPAQQGDAQLRHHLGRIVCCNVPNGSTVCSQPCRDNHCPY